ncbi:unnamed protein product [Tetraodon nigroviridis]|uniref:Chromosome undetermined SCAF14494, whole genome shotgun sequence n=1 Tax=Tetraodon nigroviridis TaxID=99883 RepID=Q4SRS7_TETNG|nr:unnamed protein product [Tetraodon nigroviridis]
MRRRPRQHQNTRAGPVRSSSLQSGPVRSSLVQSGPGRSSPVQSGPVWSSPVQAGPGRSSPVQSGPVRSRQVQPDWSLFQNVHRGAGPAPGPGGLGQEHVPRDSGGTSPGSGPQGGGNVCFSPRPFNRSRHQLSGGGADEVEMTSVAAEFEHMEIQQQFNDGVNNRWDADDWDNENSSARLFERSRIKALAGLDPGPAVVVPLPSDPVSSPPFGVSPPCGLVLTEFLVMELQSGVPGRLSPGALSPALDYAAANSPGFGGPGPSPGGPGRAPSPGGSGQAGFNYNQLEGRFKQLQGKRRSFLQTTPPATNATFETWRESSGHPGTRPEACLGDEDESAGFLSGAERRPVWASPLRTSQPSSQVPPQQRGLEAPR